MKCLIVATCLLAVASAGFVGQSVYGYSHLAHQAAHIPVLDHNGFQVDTPEVAHAKAAHFAAHAEAHARTGHAGVYSHAVASLAHTIHSAPLVHSAPLAYSGHYAHGHAYPVLDHNGFQLDTPEVAHAKAAHLATFADVAARNNVHHYRKRRGLIAAPLAYAHAYPQHIPVIGPNGVPLETPEVVAAKINHAAAHHEAAARSGHYAHYAPLAYASHGVVATHGVVAAPVAYAHGHYHGPQHLPVIGPNGVPLDTPEVAAGKHANAVAHAEAHARNGDHYGYAHLAHVAPLAHHVPLVAHNGVPLDTPEVAIAKAHHAAAHHEALARNAHHHY